MVLSVGQPATDFTLIDTDMKSHTLSALRGKKAVIAFIPAAFTGVCSKEFCSFRDSLGRFKELDAAIIGISVDAPFSNKAFANANQLNFPILSDYTRAVAKSYAGVYENFAGMNGYTAAKRSVFVVDREGIVRYAWISENPGMEPPYAEVQRAVSSIP